MQAFSTRNARHISLVTLIAAFIGGALVMTSNASADKTSDAQLPPPPLVTVSVLQSQDIRTWESFSGRLAPVASVELRPLVGGTVQQVLFNDGEYVTAKQPLFVIDPRPHQAAQNRANAQLQAARAQAKLLEDEFKRAVQLKSENLISQSQFETTASQRQSAIASVAEADALLEQAKLNLEYANITAPVSGRISRAEVTQGNVVEAGPSAPVLARIVANDKFYVEFNVDEQTYIKLSRSLSDADSMPIELTLDGDDVVYHGLFHAFDNQLDPASGTIRARAVVENTDRLLTAGMYTQVRLGSPQKASVLLVPESAIGTNQSKKFVLVVDEQQTARYREVTLGAQWQGQRVISSGLNEGDRVIVNGLSHVQPDTPVAISDTAALALAN
ncbi:MexE family multidrug efflux RND transporter periplasmic adaptor subunit [Arenicella chitinivorans]|uniref:MexE family multidrug efflux RND transporter periplasmic adaptor subunit n=1 Tax=Arenicella chitinivorans TaxID=1329800 RepID=A0A918S257_9GAMM|nr:efflux RND transporter periplasmic adaptor subunit [Arenicella chitinivorans]GHA20288.1 MexE family multidrug efflux RND transporter periplasmic adaptor subunit [Arenicella chitinivorans]